MLKDSYQLQSDIKLSESNGQDNQSLFHNNRTDNAVPYNFFCSGVDYDCSGVGVLCSGIQGTVKPES